MEFKSPQNIALATGKTIFMAGSIEMGNARHWQNEMAAFFQELGLTVFNPRRDYWDSTWEQSIENPNFYQQVNWELNAIEAADFVFFYFDPDTKSPVSLLELGMCSQMYDKHVFIVCPEGYWRKGNVEVVADRYKLRLYNSLDEFKQENKVCGSVRA